MTQQKQNGNIVAIIVMIFLFGMISFVTNLASPMGDILKFQFGVPNWMGTLGVFANFIAYAVMGYPAGNMLQKMGYKKTALIAITVGFIGVGIQTLSGVAGSFGIYLLGAFIAGFSMCLLNTVVNPMLNTLGGGGNKGNQLIQLGGSFNSLAGTSVIILTGILIPSLPCKISDVVSIDVCMASGYFCIRIHCHHSYSTYSGKKKSRKLKSTPLLLSMVLYHSVISSSEQSVSLYM